ncbi:DNA polymerase [Streptomyces sp. SID14515]|uniref:DNA polymerase n=1 Tax=Streptomyces sp. SID14515 TaxID=2706074 RepID=UPI0013CACBF8|nr:DNA polymerase [Streptomyces sp. SID14515]NEB35893.1 DNA polymerase I [Streptomyces sp. SID14515]
MAAFRRWVIDVASTGRPIGSDSETTGLDWYASGFRIRLWQFATEWESWVVPVELGPQFAAAVAWALRTLPNLVYQNGTFDALAADARLGVALEEHMPKITDTRIIAHLVDSRQDFEGGVGLSLKPLAAHYVDPSVEDPQRALQAEFRKAGGNKSTGWALIDWRNESYLRYAALDPVLCVRLLPRLLERFEAEGGRKALIPYEHRLAEVCAKIRRRGMRIDPVYTRGLVGRLAEEKATFETVAARYGVGSVNSPKQVAEALLGMGEEWTERTAGGELSVGKDVLLPMADLSTDWQRLNVRKPNALADSVLRAKRAGKWSTSYAQAMLANRDAADRVHPDLNPLGAQTGRASVSHPPLQQLPSKGWTIRRCVVADPGEVYFSVDQAAVELRVLAALSGESKMKAAIAAGKDLHGFAATMMFGEGYSGGQRTLAKIAGLGTAYQGGAVTLAKQTGQDVEVMRDTLSRYNRAFPGIKRWARALQREAMSDRAVLTTVTGRRLHLDRDRLYKVVAYACQSTARDTMGRALIEMDDRGLTPYLTGWIHDEVVGTAPKDEAQDIAKACADAMRMDLLGVPLDTDCEVTGPSWADGYGLPDEWAYRG